MEQPALSNKELKELKKKEKAEKRAAQKAAAGIPATPAGANNAGNNNQAKKKTNGATEQVVIKAIKPKTKKVALFSHLETKSQRQEGALSSVSLAKSIHPAILTLTLQYASYSIVGSIPRCKAMLQAFQTVIRDYKTPENTTLTRNLTNYLSLQIDHLKTARPLSVTMGSAIRWLKQEISVIPIDQEEQQSKADLIEAIDSFIREKIDLADKVIIQTAQQHITNNSTILTFAHSNVLQQLFLDAHAKGKEFTVIVMDSRPLFEGRAMTEALTSAGIKVKYALINSLASVLSENAVDFVFLGAHAMLSNGVLYSRVGTAMVAAGASGRGIPVLVCCESVKFSDRVQLDSVTLNELGDNASLTSDKQPIRGEKTNNALKAYLESLDSANSAQQPKKKGQQQQKKGSKEEEEKKEKQKDGLDLEGSEYLNVLNIMYDLTPTEYIQKIITEVGALPASSVPVILREYKAQ